jgi:hypothetical protein
MALEHIVTEPSTLFQSSQSPNPNSWIKDENRATRIRKIWLWSI